ncbi:hypothetical protein TNCV_481781 [Trichonephila clavipes]|nr:hypothetical protein TNCV_481781 [Trichonephila clavipes]
MSSGGRDSVEDDEPVGCPRLAVADQNIAKIHDMSEACLTKNTVASVDVERMALRNKGDVISKRCRCRSRNEAPDDSRRPRECTLCVPHESD